MKVELIDSMGSDLSVCNAARVSFAKESEWEKSGAKNDYEGVVYQKDGKQLSQKDTKLINYLAKHNHWSPFGHCFASFRIKAPLFVCRQLGKSTVGLCWNEESRRYIDHEPEFYVPETWRKRAENVKQGSSTRHITSDRIVYAESTAREEALLSYKALLDEGVCPEQARMVLPQSTYSTFIWSGSLAAFARVCKLRLDPHTQYETRLVAEQISQHMETLFPVSWRALNE